MTQSSTKIKIGLLGAGARLRQVVKLVLQESAGTVEVVAAFDPEPASQKAILAEFGESVAICQSVSELTSRPDINWVFIGSLNSVHAEQAVAALEAGKDVFCEKPLATTFEDCLRVRDKVRETGRTFAFGLVLRYSPLYQQVKELVAGGAIGELVSFEFNETLNFNHGGYIFGNWRRHRDLAGTHVLEKCCHDLDLANWITGQRAIKTASFGGRDIFVPKRAHLADKIGPNTDGVVPYRSWADLNRVDPFSEGASINDNQVAIIQYTNGVRATFHTNCQAGIPERRFYLCGTEGSLRADAYTGIIDLARVGWDSKVEVIDTKSAGGHGGGDIVMARGLIETMTKGTAPLATVEDGVRAGIVAFGIDSAMDEGQVIDLQPYWDAVDR